ncbi:MAG: hypothetical protein EAZ51_04985 [Sphingobacteriales bacterium]|nr:MAG: hypothetical protein EAZ64_08655 [Sphingobacteriales bacterium]TAF81030.1 MAG: hypothetical protein EAZ51_04985 [Sphingobacteriales bacterium]
MADKQKYSLEYEIKSSVKILYNFISEPNCLAQWFADDVRIKGHIYTFAWNDGEQQDAKLLSTKENKLVRFKWVDEEAHTFFEFEVVKDELTNDVALIITDFAAKENIKEKTSIWNIQIENLQAVLGA